MTQLKGCPWDTVIGLDDIVSDNYPQNPNIGSEKESISSDCWGHHNFYKKDGFWYQYVPSCKRFKRGSEPSDLPEYTEPFWERLNKKFASQVEKWYQTNRPAK